MLYTQISNCDRTKYCEKDDHKVEPDQFFEVKTDAEITGEQDKAGNSHIKDGVNQYMDLCVKK